IVVDDSGPARQAPDLSKWRRSLKLKQWRNENTLGLPSARNAGAGLATGDFLVFLDSDDRLAPTFIQDTLHELRQCGVDGVYTLVQLFGDSSFLWEPECTLIALLSGLPGPATFLMKREVFERVGGFKTQLLYNCDHDFWISAVAQGFRFARLNKPLFLYRKHPRSLSTIRRSEWWQAIPRLINEHKELYAEHFAEILTAKERQYRQLEEQYHHIYREWQQSDRRCTELNEKYNTLCSSPSFRAFQRLLDYKQRLLERLSTRKRASSSTADLT
ncbi:MAG TPA: glycosyltransferase family A protein, partial [Candidatus Obscuribacterales bacterium]